MSRDLPRAERCGGEGDDGARISSNELFAEVLLVEGGGGFQRHHDSESRRDSGSAEGGTATGRGGAPLSRLRMRLVVVIERGLQTLLCFVINRQRQLLYPIVNHEGFDIECCEQIVSGK